MRRREEAMRPARPDDSALRGCMIAITVYAVAGLLVGAIILAARAGL